MRIDVYASQWHYLDHLEPIWRALPDGVRGAVLVTATPLRRHPLAVAADGAVDGAERISRVLVAGAPDVETARRNHWGCALVEHGAGQGYSDARDHPSYPGGSQRDGVGVFLCTNRSVAERNDRRYGPRSVVCGSPRLDVLDAIRAGRRGTEQPSRPTLALTWHFGCRVSRESFWAWDEFKASLVDLRTSWDGPVIGTAHPKAFRHVEVAYRQAGIEPVPLWADVVARADVVSFDNSSAGYEAAALGIPVVLVESQRWRRDVTHGLRFWEYDDIGPTVRAGSDPRRLGEEWADAAREALSGADGEADWARRSAEVTAILYPHRGEAADLAASALCRWVGSGS